MSDDKRRILIVDDAKPNIQVLNGMLKDRYRVSFALNGPKALEIAASDRSPDLILLDVNMPEMDGFEVLAHLRADEGTRGIPVILVTGADRAEDEERGYAAGAVGFVRKPVDPDRLLALVADHVG